MQRYHSNAGEKVRRNIELIVEGIPDCYVKQQYCIANGIEPEDTPPNIEYAYPIDTLSHSKSNLKSNLKSKSKTEEEEGRKRNRKRLTAVLFRPLINCLRFVISTRIKQENLIQKMQLCLKI